MTDSVQKGTITQARRSAVEKVEEEKKSSSSASLNEDEQKEIAQYQELQESLKNLKDKVGASIKIKSSRSNSKKKKAFGKTYSVSSDDQASSDEEVKNDRFGVSPEADK